MASKKFKKTRIAETEGSNFGNYGEANGGGSPKGGIWGGRSGRVGWDVREAEGEVKEGENRKDQPRTRDGKFTYNSVNGKETKYDGRGETVNPLLTGGQNGIYIENVDKRGKSHSGVREQFENKSGELYDKYKGIYYQKESEKITKEGKKYVTKFSLGDIWELAKYSWDATKGMFGGGSSLLPDEDSMFQETKRGRSSKLENRAKALAKSSGAEQYVLNDQGGIAKRGESSLEKALKRFADELKGGSLKHSPAQIQAVRDKAAATGMDLSHVSDEQIDELMDQFVALQ